jgi:hypothetical protein
MSLFSLTSQDVSSACVLKRHDIALPDKTHKLGRTGNQLLWYLKALRQYPLDALHKITGVLGQNCQFTSMDSSLGLLAQPYSTCDTLTTSGARRHLTSIKTKQRNRLNVEAAPILTLTKIRSRVEVLAFHKQAQSSH